MKKVKTIKVQILWKDNFVYYEDLVLYRIGQAIGKLSCMKEGKDQQGDFFEPDCDYEMIIRPIKSKK